MTGKVYVSTMGFCWFVCEHLHTTCSIHVFIFVMLSTELKDLS